MPGFVFYPVLIDWGDDSPPSSYSLGPGDLSTVIPNDITEITFDPTQLQHTYAEAGTYIVHLTIHSNSGSGGGGPVDPGDWGIDQSWTVVVGGTIPLSMVARVGPATYSLD